MRITLPVVALLVSAAPTTSAPRGDTRVFMDSAHLNADHTVTLPLHEGRVGERRVWYIVTDASTGDAAERFGSNRSQKLAHARGTGAVQHGAFETDGLLHFD